MKLFNFFKKNKQENKKKDNQYSKTDEYLKEKQLQNELLVAFDKKDNKKIYKIINLLKNVNYKYKTIEHYDYGETGGENTPILIKAIEKNNYEAVELLIQKGVDINNFKELWISNADTLLYSPLDVAIKEKNQKITNLLIQSDANIFLNSDFTGKYKNSIIYKICTELDSNVLKNAIHKFKQSNDLESLNKLKHSFSFNGLDEIIKHNKSEKILDLLYSEQIINNEDLLCYYAHSNNFKKTKELLKTTNVNSESKLGNNIYFESPWYSHPVYSDNYNFNKKTTPLIEATIKNNKNIIKYLIKKGANVNSIDTYKNTPLHYASSKNFDVIKLLIENGSDLFLRNNDGLIPINKFLKTSYIQNKKSYENFKYFFEKTFSKEKNNLKTDLEISKESIEKMQKGSLDKLNHYKKDIKDVINHWKWNIKNNLNYKNYELQKVLKKNEYFTNANKKLRKWKECEKYQKIALNLPVKKINEMDLFNTKTQKNISDFITKSKTVKIKSKENKNITVLTAN